MSDNKGYTTLESARFERKFVLENCGISYAEHLIKFNRGAFRSIYSKRRINNVYFDTPNLSSFYDNQFGKSRRTKIRIRWYGETFGKVESPILEFKQKYGAAGKKDSFPLVDFTLEQHFTTTLWQKIFDESGLPDYVRLELKNVIPTLLNSYERKYYQSFDSLFRFTLDYNLSFFNIRTNNSSFLEKVTKKETVILELKYDLKNDEKVKRITSMIPTRLNKFSKYVHGIEVFHPYLAV